MTRPAAALSVLLAIAAVLALNVTPALAHATPMVYEPGAASVLEKAPGRVRIQFSEHIEPKASGITIFAPDGSRADTNDSMPDAADSRIFTVGLRDAGEGTYTASWQVVSQDDGHFTKGGFSFTVGNKLPRAPAGAGQVHVENSSTFSQAIAIGTELLGQSMLLGVLAVIVLSRRSFLRSKISGVQQAAFQRSCELVVAGGTALIVSGVLSFLVLKTIDLQASRAAEFAATFQIFLSTVDGRLALYRAIAGVAFAAVFYLVRNRVFSRQGFTANEAILLALVAIMILVRARVSHAAASHFLPSFSILMNAVHLLVKEFWVGGLIALTFILMPILSKLGRASVTASILTSIAKYLSIALALTGLTGAYIVWLHLKSPSNLFTSQWGERFLVLCAFAGIFVVMRLYHQLIGDRCVVASCHSPQTGYRREVVAALQYSIPIEMCVGVVVLFVTSYLIITTPPYPPEHFALEKRAVSREAEIALSVHPFEQKEFLISVTDEKTGLPVQLTDAVVSLQNVEKNIGPVVAETEPRFPGGFTFSRDSLSLPGTWRIDVTARRSEAYDAVASFQLDYPAELEASRVSGDARHFGAFEAIIALAALGGLGLAFLLYRFSANLNARCADFAERRGLSASGFSVARGVMGAAPATLLLSLAIWISYEVLVKTDFEKLCERNRGTWTQATPMRAGMTLSPATVTGCTAAAGDFHFADMREYAYFLGKPNSTGHAHQH